MTSGTTGDRRGRSYHPTLAVYDRSMLINFRQRFMAGYPRLPMAILFPLQQRAAQLFAGPLFDAGDARMWHGQTAK